MLSEGDDWNEVFGELSSAVRIFGDASFRETSIYPLIRVFITNSDRTLYTGKNYAVMKGNASELLFLQLNKDIIDYKIDKKTAIFAENNSTIYNIIECPSMAEWGRESNSLLWNFLKAKAAQHNLKEAKELFLQNLNYCIRSSGNSALHHSTRKEIWLTILLFELLTSLVEFDG